MDSATNLKREDILIQVRDKLRKDQVKLWLPPYYDQQTSSPQAEALKVLSQGFSEELSIPPDDCLSALTELQVSSLENLQQNARYRECGLATIKIKVVQSDGSSTMITKELSLTATVQFLKDMLGQELGLTSDRLKLIGSGKVLADNNVLTFHGIKNGQKIMAIVLPESHGNIRDSEAPLKEVEFLKNASSMLALDDDYMELEDQFGNPVKIPKAEKKALMVAMTLYEKGRSSLKRKDYSNALVFLLEADEEFKHCNSRLLDIVDNYALLHLDVVWCYLNLQSVAHLPEAYGRLKNCEQRLQKTYGENLERLILTNGGAGNEGVSLMRLHLLQAIVLYHQNNRQEALTLLKKAQQELCALKVDENSVLLLAELGFSITEAKLGLRIHKGDINLAASHIRDLREKKENARKKALAEKIAERERVSLGKCADGIQYVDPKFLNMLVNMGYNKEASRIALQKSNNIISDSIQYMTENPLPGPSQSRSQEMLSYINCLVPELEAAGFDRNMAKMALHKFNGDIMKAAEELLANNGVIEGDTSILDVVKQHFGSTSKRSKEKDEMFKQLTENMTVEEDDPLDPTLMQDELFLNQYLSLLENK